MQRAGGAFRRPDLGSCGNPGPASAAACTNPFEGEDRARIAGAKLFARECAACHGANGAGIGKALPLNQADVQTAAPSALFWFLRNGLLNVACRSSPVCLSLSAGRL